MRLALVAIAILALISQTAEAYIDPGTTQTVLSTVGSALAAVGALLVAAGAAMAIVGRRLWSALLIALRASARVGSTLKGKLITVALVGSAVTLCWLLPNQLTFGLLARQNNDAKPRQRVVLVGMDGLDPKLLKRFMNDGHLPYFRALADQGSFKPLSTINPVQSPVVWASMATGLGPAGHGIYDFIGRKESYIPKLALTSRQDNIFDGAFVPPVKPQLFFWEKLAAAGIPAKVIRWPMTFPATGAATVVSGLGTPDLLGNMGRYTIVTDTPADLPPDIKGELISVAFKERNWSSFELTGPTIDTLLGPKTTSATVRIRKSTKQSRSDHQPNLGHRSQYSEGEQITLLIGDQETSLTIGEVSPWLQVDFGNDLHGIFHAMVLETDPNFQLYISPIEIDPKKPKFPIATEDYAATLAAGSGRFHTLGMMEDTNALADDILTDEQFLALVKGAHEEAVELFWQGFDQSNSGLYSFVFTGVDRIQHMFWRYIDPEHPLYDEDLADTFEGVILRAYQDLDKVVGDLHQRLDRQRDTLLIVSDHGFNSYRRSFHVNSWLVQRGYMTLHDGESEVGALFRNVDWSKTKAFAVGFSQIFLNIRDREAQGIVTLAEADQLRRQIKNDLLKLRDPSHYRKAYSPGLRHKKSIPVNAGTRSRTGPGTLAWLPL